MPNTCTSIIYNKERYYTLQKLHYIDYFAEILAKMCRLRAMLHSAEAILIIEYLREYEFVFATALGHESGDPGVLFAEKKPRVEKLV
jgi:hypothetical protein